MEKDPWNDDSKTSYIPSELKTPGFLFDVKEAEDELNRSSIGSPHIQSTLINFEEVLNDHLDPKYLDTTAGVTGRAFFADSEGDTIYDVDDRPKNDIISAQNLSYVGIELVFLEYDSDEPIFKAMCRFNSTEGDGEIDTLYFAPEDLILFMPKHQLSGEINSSASLSVDQQDKLIKSILEKHADDAKIVRSSSQFILGNSEEQNRILSSCAKRIANFINEEYGEQELEITASEFLLITASDFTHIDQRLKPKSEWHLPFGQFDDCTFYELVGQLQDEKIGNIFKHQPLIVLVSYITGCQYLIPISAFKSANGIEE